MVRRPFGVLSVALAVHAAAPFVAPPPAVAQSPMTGGSIAPAYEGFWRNPDGTYDLLFGYFNRNWEEEIHIPIGPDNNLQPGGPDLDQPTHFLPRRNQFVFRVRVPADFGDGEVVWTITANGETNTAYGTLRPEYAVDEVVMSANFGAGGQTGFNPQLVGNLPPEVTLEGENQRTARVGEAVALSAVATDDGKPGRRGMPAGAVGQSQFVPNSAAGLRFSWFHYRGPGEIAFDPPQAKVWQDNRDGASSPWAAGWSPPSIPPDNRWSATATFGEPGTYVVRALAHDGGLVDYEDVTVVVTP
ncbi:MAG: hypothetical protein WEG36_07685 [Gemmatimonadota bacterium]